MSTPTSPQAPPAFLLRDLDPAARDELEWVARGMHLTLVEVEGAKGGAAYPLVWTRERLRELLDPRRHVARVFLAVLAADPVALAGYTILRVDTLADGRDYGLFSTTWIDPPQRRQGLADRLLDHGEAWIRGQRLGEAATWTSAGNQRLIRLYEKHGYAVTDTAVNDGSPMVRLSKALPAAATS
jgi:GNAT superfamily N-acetyltransferase